MTDLSARLALKACLPRSWPAFFERHGNFTSAQLATIPAVLAGDNVIVCAPTAGGKTEAVVAPLIERHCPPTSSTHPPPIGTAGGLPGERRCGIRRQLALGTSNLERTNDGRRRTKVGHSGVRPSSFVLRLFGTIARTE